MPRYPFLGRGMRHPWSLRCQSYGLPQGLDTNTGHREAACSRATGPHSAKPFTTLRPGLLRTPDVPDGQLGSRPGEGRSLSPCKLSQQGSCRPLPPRKERGARGGGPKDPGSSHLQKQLGLSPAWDYVGRQGGLRQGGGQQGDKGACLPHQQPGYKKLQRGQSRATLPCRAQWEDEKGFPWLPLGEREYSDQTRVKGSQRELQPKPGMQGPGAGGKGRTATHSPAAPTCRWSPSREQQGGGGGGGDSRGLEGGLCPPSPLPPLCP